MIQKYLDDVVWVMDGMDYPYLNCWGFARLARHELYNLPLLPRSNIDAHDKRGLTDASVGIVESYLVQIPRPKKGAFAAVWRGRLCVHVALVVEIDGRLAIMEADEHINCRWQWLNDWERKQTKVLYYYDRS
jgi:hypothetical protein